MEPPSLPSRLPQQFLAATSSAAQTRQLGRKLARLLRPGDLLCLRGDLGAGKTTFVQGLARGLGVPDPATSPSFTLLHEHRGRLPFLHLDLYRLGPADLADVGIDDLLDGDPVVAVEWAEHLPDRLCSEALELEFHFAESAPNERRIILRARGSRARELIQAFTGEWHARPRP
jgi:tRNA threonylcarbamoyladenosine biosynthesis protein TsaE